MSTLKFQNTTALHLLLHLLPPGPQGTATANAATASLQTGDIMHLG